MRPVPAPHRRSHRNSCVRSWRSPVSPRATRGGQSASGRLASWPTKPSSEASSSASPPALSGGSWFLEAAALQPHRSRYWLTPRGDDPAAFATQAQTVCDLYLAAPTLQAQGVHVVSTDEMTGIQALERAAPTLPMRPGQVERREFEYVRNGTQTLIANFAVPTGE